MKSPDREYGEHILHQEHNRAVNREHLFQGREAGILQAIADGMTEDEARKHLKLPAFRYNSLVDSITDKVLEKFGKGEGEITPREGIILGIQLGIRDGSITRPKPTE